MKSLFVKITALALLVASVFTLAGCKGTPENNDTPESKDEPYAYEIGKVYAVIDVKDFGKITVELCPGDAPISVENFVELANRGIYKNSTFHRSLSNFMIQGGDPADDSIELTPIVGEFEANGYVNDIDHVRGVISMARMPTSNDSATSQFFICNADYPSLNGQYAAFGFVVSGMDVVDEVTEYGMKYTSYQQNGFIYDETKMPVISDISIVDNRTSSED